MRNFNILPEIVGIAALAWLAYHLTNWLAKQGLSVIDLALQTAGLK